MHEERSTGCTKPTRVQTIFWPMDTSLHGKKSVAQKTMLRELRHFNNNVKAEFEDQESKSGCSRPVRPFKPKTKLQTSILRTMPRVRQAAAMAADASSAAASAVEKRMKDMSLRQKKQEKACYDDIRPTAKDVQRLAKMARSTNSTTDQTAMPSSSSTDRVAPVLRSSSSRDHVPQLYEHSVYGSTPELHDLVTYNLAAGGWQVLGRKCVASKSRAAASHIVVPGMLGNQLECSAASLHCRAFGKTLIAQAFLEGKATALGPVSFEPLGVGNRMLKLELYISNASHTKHHRVVDEMKFIAASDHIKKRYSFDVKESVDSDVVIEHFKQLCGRNDLAYRNVRWIVQKDELNPSRLALSSVLQKPIKYTSTFVLTMSSFVSGLGTTASST